MEALTTDPNNNDAVAAYDDDTTFAALVANEEVIAWDDDTEYDAVLGVNVIEFAALAVVANDAVSGTNVIDVAAEAVAGIKVIEVAALAVVANEAVVGVKVMDVAALAVVAYELLTIPVILLPSPLNPVDAVTDPVTYIPFSTWNVVPAIRSGDILGVVSIWSSPDATGTRPMVSTVSLPNDPVFFGPAIIMALLYADPLKFS